MIFITVGLEQFPFDRLLRAMDHLAESGTIQGPVFAQIGHSRYEPRHFKFCRFLPFDQMRTHLLEADTVVCHGGVGTILLALELGKIPLVLPRRAEFGEQLDDHQLDLVSRLREGNRVIVADTEERLAEKLAQYEELKKKMPPRSESTELNSLVQFLHATLKESHGS